MNRVAMFAIPQMLILLLVSCFQPTHATELYESDRDLAGIATSNPHIYRKVIDAGAKLLIVKGRKPS